ncbi:MAG: biopolymer transporter ExbB [Rhodobacteraceae bacterium]|nr:biopolymer transporter ExbB [Paracoccaceae bacterium]
MNRRDREAEPFFSHPVRQIFLMLIALGLVGGGLFLAFPRVAPVFLANLYLNGFIFLVFIIGIVTCFAQVFQLSSSVNWIKGFAEERPGHSLVRPPRLLAPLAALLRSRGREMQINATSARSILDSVATRIDEARDITRYIVNLLIFLGLLGTFYGLATTVPAVVETIRSLAPNDSDTGMEVFARLMSGLEAQLGGMGVAFSSSLLGLAGSLVVGLLELFASHGQNRFYRELEEWLSTITRLGIASADGSDEGSQAIAVLDRMAEQLDVLQTLFVQSDESRALVDERLGEVSEALSGLIRRLDSETNPAAALDRLADGQDRLISVIERSGSRAASSEALDRIADGQERMIAALEGTSKEGGAHWDAENRMRMRSIDVQLLRILEELTAGRQDAVSELRAELRALTRAVRGEDQDS